MTIEPPQAPTAPAPAVRPTPPKPPRIDRSPFVKDSADGSSSAPQNNEPQETPQLKREVETPETMARDAVAHGSGALTKRTVNADEEPPPAAKPTTPRRENPLPADTQSDYDRGQDVLREFRNLDANEAQSNYQPPAQSSAEQRTPNIPKLNYHEEHGGGYWLFTLIFVVVATFVIAKKFLFTDKPALTKSELFDDTKKATTVKPPPKSVQNYVAQSDMKSVAKPVPKPVVKPAKPAVKPTVQSDVKPTVKPARLPEKKSDEKRPHFEVRV